MCYGYERIAAQNRRFRSNGGWLIQNFSQNTRLNGLLHGIKIWTDFSSVLSQTDRRTDRILTVRLRLHSMQRSKKQSKVKYFLSHMGPQGSDELGFYSPQPNTMHEYVASVLCGVPIYSPAFAGTKLYCLVTEAHIGVSSLPKATAQWCRGRTQTRNLQITSPMPYILIYHITIYRITSIQCIALWSTNKRNKKQTLEWLA